ncbi:hypothetical protein HYV88_06100 [Candidatus Woesearchaeota archaeon]|nr:hypothetical protein [Candidatus Woesearchaeota archaeon]
MSNQLDLELLEKRIEEELVNADSIRMPVETGLDRTNALAMINQVKDYLTGKRYVVSVTAVMQMRGNFDSIIYELGIRAHV